MIYFLLTLCIHCGSPKEKGDGVTLLLKSLSQRPSWWITCQSESCWSVTTKVEAERVYVPEALISAIKCPSPEGIYVTSVYNSVRIAQRALTCYDLPQRSKKCYSPTCSEEETSRESYRLPLRLDFIWSVSYIALVTVSSQ